MNPKTAALASISIFGIWVVFNIILVSLGAVKSPWHTLGIYSVGGSVFSLLSLGLGIFARVRGKAVLTPKIYGLALIPILGGASFLACFLLAILGIY